MENQETLDIFKKNLEKKGKAYIFHDRIFHKSKTRTFMESIDLKKNRFEIIIFAIWCILTLIGVMHHEPWRDEVQAFLIARDLSIPGIFSQLKYEGHFILWFLVLKVFSSLGVEYLSMISWLLSAAAYVIFLFCSPFSKQLKAISLFSAPFLYWYPIVSRCYALIPLCLFAIAALFPQRKKYPVMYGILIVLLANTHVVIEGIVFALFLFSLYEAWNERKQNKKLWLIPLLIFVGVLFAFLSVVQSIFYSDSVKKECFNVIQLFFLFCMNMTGFDVIFTTGIPLNISFAISLICGILFLYLSKSKWFAIVLAVAFLVLYMNGIVFASAIIIWGMVFFIVFHKKSALFSIGIMLSLLCVIPIVIRFCGLNMQRSLLLFYFILFFGWLFYDHLKQQDLSEAKRFLKSLSRKIIPFLLLSVLGGFVMLQTDFYSPFSGLQETGLFLRSLPEDFQVCTFCKDDKLTAVTAWTKKKIHVLSYDFDCTFEPRNIRKPEVIDCDKYTAQLAFPAKKAVVVGKDDKAIEFLKRQPYQMIFASQENPCTESERFFVFVHSAFIKKNRDLSRHK